MRLRSYVTQASRWDRLALSGWRGRSRSSRVKTCDEIAIGRCSLPFLIPRRATGRMEDSMSRSTTFTTVVAALIMLLTITPSWGQTPVCASPGCNPTASDANFNTAGGTGALGSLPGSDNTAFGDNALTSNTTGGSNTASGVNALFSNTTGKENTATGGGSLVGNSTGSKNTA